ncbi:AbiH family protein [Acinetobacter pittii]|uniref:AbiH family protein n=6 Tax=Moraxellaceae TaxID=468 RepID=UPI00071090AC|nr:AbiH family protein [Acinetobacter pittii]KRJ21224.1 hypothetical protein APC78_06805 [Acinetobacter pittii]MCU4343911.1 bacteriophage abortive infection AbiH family protein [Acinetobacter pittii]MCU4354345.1 bacteriophage abortive infection AbiH family protein [Acinetobacter pittii]
MNILIVGNGFDLSHYLPTKYDHFMVAMEAIENWDLSVGEMSFDDLFGSLYEKENYFFRYTKAMYQTDETKISVDQIIELKQHLKENVWYQYFSDHVRQVRTWIDFEKKIEEVLNYFTKLFEKITDFYNKDNNLELEVKTSISNDSTSNKFIYLGERACDALSCVKILEKKYYKSVRDSDGYREFNYTDLKSKNYNYFISDKYIKRFDKYDFYIVENSIGDLNESLNNFIDIFNWYLCLICDLKFKNGIDDSYISNYDKVYSFNYTNTYTKICNNDRYVDFLHGKAGVNQNIVLGISDLKSESLKNIKAYGFTKYHQKMYKNTDYIFLSEIINHFYSTERKVKSLEDEINSYLDNPSLSVDVYFRTMFDAKTRDYGVLKQSSEETYNIQIWGHSLDQSDENYIKEIFSFNGEFIQQRCNIIVFYFNNYAKFELLNNLLSILGSNLVERWMKNGWLKFEPNPNLVEINNIQPVDLT